MKHQPYSFQILLASFTFVFEFTTSTNLPPTFTHEINNLVLSENTPLETVVYNIDATDPENSTIKYGLYGTDLLKINSETGEIIVVKNLDHEVNDTLNFFVTVEDEVQDAPVGGNNIVEVPVTAIILDENDNEPQFENVPYNVFVNEDTGIGATVFTNIYVTDADTVGDAIEVECVNLYESDNTCDVFSVVAVDSAQNSYNGSLVLHQKLNYSVKTEYKFLIKATDGALNSTTPVVISVVDVQDTPPRFLGLKNVAIDEDVPINSLVLTVYAEDGDRGAPRRIIYELVNNPMDYFLIDPITGQIRTARPLDKEAISNPYGLLTLEIQASEVVDGVVGADSLTSTKASVNITVRDVNDEPPSFNKKEYFVEIPEDIRIGDMLPNLDMTVTDPDMGNNSVFSLSLDDISYSFKIFPETVNGSSEAAIQVVNSSLDYEDPNQRKFIILAIAKELYTNPKLSSTATITVTVFDANDNFPTFDQKSYTAVVSEVAAPGSLVTTILAKDRDSGSFGEFGIIYSISGEGSEKFDVNNRTGVITVAECEEPGHLVCLDYESKSVYSLTYKATDNDGQGHFAEVPLKIILTDSNDNAPVFNSSVYNVSVNEGAAKFEPDLIVQAKDIDQTSHIVYSIISGNENEIFNIDPNTGKIRIASNKIISFSKNENQNSMPLTIEATDGKFTTTAIVNVNVIDVNDHAPKFEQQHYHISIPESTEVGSSIFQVIATDDDSGVNAEINYYFKKNISDFIIENSTGIIKISSKLDFDRQNMYNIEIFAVDGGITSLSSSAMLSIQVFNVNDKLPYFIPTNQKTEIMKDVKIGTVIHTLTAIDPDVNSTDVLNYEIIEPISATNKYGEESEDLTYKHFFSVEKKSGKVLVNSSLDRDIAAVVQLTVRVIDTTAPLLQQGQGTLTVSIIDINDRPPIFLPPWTKERPQYNLQLEEELPVGTIVSTFTAVDDDSPISTYKIYPESKYFEINNGTGIVQIKERIDYEMLKVLNFTIIAYDSGIPQLNASANVFVTVLNINDNSPKFTSEVYNATVKENSPIGTHVMTVRADDLDDEEYGVVTYNLTGEHTENFQINTTTGEIYVSNPLFLDHELLNETVIQVVASDGAPGSLKHTHTVPVHIAILDVNDNPPKFNQTSYNATISENLRFNPPYIVLQVFAVDEDEGINGNINYRIIEGNEDGLFLLSEDTGILYVHKSLSGRTGKFILNIEANDNGEPRMSDNCFIYIDVMNVNDYKPTFIYPTAASSTVEINENPSEEYLVITVRAVDKDSGENGRVTYHLKVDDQNVQSTEEFVIDQNSGELRTRLYLDKKMKDRYELTLVARDHGMPMWHETLHYLTVLLINPKDNDITFPSQKTNQYKFSISENSPPNTLVGEVEVLHLNETKYAKVYYYLISSFEDNIFYIDKLDGKIYTNKALDREQVDGYDLVVLANNEPDFYLTAMEQNRILHNDTDASDIIAMVKVVVTDVNDNAPVFENSSYYGAVNSIAKVNSFVLNVSAHDPDLDLNGSFVYYVKSSNLYKYGSVESSGFVIPSPFNVSQKGEVFTATSLVENNQNRFIVDLVAKEVAYPERETTTKVYVWIYEPEQLIRVILSRPVDEVLKEKREILSELSNATNYLIIASDLKPHTNESGHINKEWSDMYILGVNHSTQTIASIYDILKIIDARYDFLKDYYAGFAIENVLPVVAQEVEETFDPALSALIALGVVLVVGVITFIVVCCFLRKWMMSPNDLKKKKDALISKAIIDELNTTENPLWIEQKLKIYEEQELTMQVFNEPDQAVMERRNSGEFILDDNTYATIQHPNRRGSSHTATLSLGEDIADYATLSRLPRNSMASQDSLKDNVNYYEAAMGFQGSTFQVPDSSLGDPESEEYRSHHDSQMTVNNEGQLEYVAELI
ncbi:hypothetical protein FQR65_LT04041 [Abscondita terminalis]|nr:hypothetical protein FQR65_LT04041 [Abscondita terminalis]